MRKLLFVAALLSVLFAQSASAQYYRTINKAIPGADGSEVFDTFNISGLLPGVMNDTFGLDSVTLNISYDYDANLVISLISPDGTIVHLSDKEGYDADFTGACFSMDVTNFVKDSHSPFTGNQQPENWLGMINNGSNGNGNWVLHILNQPGGSADSGILINWGLHFNHHPAPPAFFDSSTLPIVVINTHDTIIDIIATPVQGIMGIIDNHTGLNHTTDPFNGYHGNVSLHSHGSSTLSFPTLSYTLTTETPAGADSNAVVLGMPADHSWVLYAPWDDKSLIRNVITYRLSNDMGEYAPRTRLCQLILNNDYRGVYVMIEKISHGSNRVNVHKMSAADTTGTALTGGYIIETDRGTPGPGGFASNFSTCDSGSGDFPEYLYIYPKPEDINAPQQNYITAYVDSFESKMKYHDLYDSVNGYRKYLDVPSIIDQQLLQELGRNVDAYRASTYFHKNRGGKLMGGPIWDFNEAYGNVNYDTAWDYNEFQYNEPCPSPGYIPFWWKTITTDTNYYNELKCRYSNLRLSVFDTVHIQGLIDSLVGVLRGPAAYHYERWPVLGVYLWPEYYVGSTYNDDVNFMKDWLRSRIHFMDSVLFKPSCIDTTAPPSLGVVTTSPQNKISIFPNPTDNYINIAATLPVSRIVILNMLGQQVYETTEQNTRYAISMRQYHVSSGIYTVLVYTGDTAPVRQKIVLTE